MSTSNTTTPSPPLHYGLILYPGFQALDVFGPLDILNILQSQHQPNMTLSILSSTLSPVSTSTSSTTSTFQQQILPTHTFAAPPAHNLDVLLVPGGISSRDTKNTAAAEAFIKSAYPSCQYLITVCTGSAVVARAGILDNRRATTNKKAFAWASSQGLKVDWVRKARWVVDGNIWTSSGISAGMDCAYAFVGSVYGEEVATDVAERSEYVRNMDPEDDVFAGLNGLVD